MLVADVEGTPYKMMPTGANRFRMLNPPRDYVSETVFEPGKGSARPRMLVTSTYEDGDVEKETFEPVDRWSPTAADLAAFAGTYTSRELATTWRLAVENGKLLVRHRGIPAEPMSPTVRDAFTLEGMNLVFRRSGGKVAGFVLDAGRVRGVAFVRAAD